MKNILEKAGIPYTSDIVGAATDVKQKSVKRVTNLIFGILFLVLGIIMAFLGLLVLSLLFTTPFGGVTFGYLFLLLPITLMLFLTYAVVVGSFSTASNWFLVLYKKHLLYKYKKDDNGKAYEQIEVRIDEIERCYILCEYREGITVKGTNTSAHYMSVHILHKEADENKYISVYGLDGYEDISGLINHLEKEQNIPIYYATARQGLGQELNDLESLENAELITFSGNLKDYNLGFSLN